MSNVWLVPWRTTWSIQNLWNMEVAVWTFGGNIDRTSKVNSSLLVKIESLGWGPMLGVVDLLKALVLLEDSCLGNSTIVRLFCSSLGRTIEVSISLSPIQTLEWGGGLTIDPPPPLAENLYFFLGTSSTLIFHLSLMRGRSSLFDQQPPYWSSLLGSSLVL